MILFDPESPLNKEKEGKSEQVVKNYISTQPTLVVFLNLNNVDTSYAFVTRLFL